MATRNEIRPYSPQHPGFILKAELEERGIKQKDFAEMIGMRPSHLNALLHGKRNISSQLATRIEAVLEIPAHVWLNLQMNYNLDSVRATNPVMDDCTTPNLQGYALAQPSQQEQDFWDLAFRSGQKDAIRKMSQVLKERGVSGSTIQEIQGIL